MSTEASKSVHQLAQKGFGEGTNELYDRARPTYQSVVLEHIRKVAGEDKDGLNIVEIGSGTGIFTRALLSHPAWAGNAIASLRAVEPSAGMREVFVKSVTDPRVNVNEGTFDRTGAPEGAGDLVIIAQAFHWCPDHEAALREFARILKPGGHVVLVWNLENREAAGWVAQLRDVYEKYEQGSPQFRLGLWRAVFSAPSYSRLFEPPLESVFSWTVPTTMDVVMDRVCSKSYIAVQSEEEKRKIREQVKGLLTRGDGRVWVDETQGVFEYPYETFVVVLRKK